MSKVFLSLLLQLIPFFLSAQKPIFNILHQPYELQIYTTKNGLSQVSVNDIVADDEGFLWVGTQSGLNQFDGTLFHTFDNDNNGKQTCGNYINKLLPDGNLIWIGTRDAGLCYFNKQDHYFYNVEASRNFSIEDMAMDRFHNLFLTMENKGVGFLSVDKTNSVYSLNTLSFFSNKNITVTALYISQGGILWAGTNEGRLFYAEIKNDPRKLDFKEFKLLENVDKIFVFSSNNAEKLWVGTQNKLLCINLTTLNTEQVSFSSRKSTPVVYELQWQDNILWIGTGAGLYEYDAQKQQVVNKYMHREQDLSSISNNVVYSIFPDQHGQLWVGTGKYLNLFYKNNTFDKIQAGTHGKGLLNSNIVFSILKTNNDLWVGTSGGGINLIRGHKNYTFTKKTHGLPSNICFTLLTDNNNIWAGTREGLVIIKNCNAPFNNMQIQKIFHNPLNTQSLSSNFIRYLYKDSANNIWLCTSGGGLNRFTGNLSKNIIRFKQYRHHPGQNNTIVSDKVNYILETGKNRYWIATDKGVCTLSVDNTGNTEKFSRVTVNNTSILDKEVIYSLLKDKKGGIWIGTTNGLHYLKNKHLTSYNVKSGLPDNVIYGILEDFDSNIWVSTNKGLSCFNTKTKSFTNYHQADGLSSEEYDLHAKYIDSTGTLYFGGIDGITRFSPKNIKFRFQTGKLFLENIQITNPTNNSAETFYLKNHQTISIKQNQFPVTINFSSVNLLHDKNTTFAYRLLPGNPNWNIIKNKRFIQLLSLPPNSYTIEIQALTQGKIKPGNQVLKVPVNVLPYWWQSRLAWLSYFIIIVLIVVFVFRFSLKRKLEHQENLRLKEVNTLKSHLYTNITHEFRTPLTVIKGMTHEIRNSLSKKEQENCNNKLEMIDRNSDKLLHLVQQMLDMSKIENGKMNLHLIRDNIVSYLQYVMESFQSMADSKNIKLVFYHETSNIIMDFDQDKIFIIVSNLLSNAIKFTSPGGKVIFHVKSEKSDRAGNLVIKVQDSGIGIDKKHLPHIFDRFYQVDNSHTYKGTGIGLALTKELVELMNGTISVSSIPNVRTEFCIAIPITTDAPLQKTKPVIPIEKQNEPDTVEIVEESGSRNLPLALVVEDNTDVAKYIISCLTGKYRVKWAPNGTKGIEEAANSIPDIVISDVMMPEKDGFEVCDTLKQDHRTSHIPIVLLTAKATDTDRIEGLQHGADAYLTKPFNKEELFVRLEQLIKIRRQLQEKYSKVDITLTEKKQPTGEEVFLQKALTIIKNNLDNPELDARVLAAGLNLSESQLYRKLKALSGKSTSLFIRATRLSASKELLKAGELNISEVAWQCGFSDPSWFSRIFKQEFGVSPSAYGK